IFRLFAPFYTLLLRIEECFEVMKLLIVGSRWRKNPTNKQKNICKCRFFFVSLQAITLTVNG
ncbi:MAG: hypothetical protein J6P74_06100, partial [Paludibacteraceae bacterium]|nr:hypothetical protein [Paludibacteraceae bacterium]